MARFGTSTRRRRNYWWEKVQLRRQRARLDRERSVQEMNEQVERETRHDAAPTPRWLLREGQLRAPETQIATGLLNCTVDTNRAINEERNIPALCPNGERDSSHLYFPTSSYLYTPDTPTLHDFMTLPDECLGNVEREIDQRHRVNPRVREGENDYGLDLTLSLKPTSEADTSTQLPALNTNLSKFKVVSLAHLRGDHHTRSGR